MPTVGFIGLGRLGLDCAEVFARHYLTLGSDIEPRHSTAVKIVDIETVIQSSDWIFIAVPTPHHPDYDGSRPSHGLPPRDFDFLPVIQVLDQIQSLATEPRRVVLISTVLPGTVRQHLRPRLDHRHQLIYNPYLIAMGSTQWDMVNPEMLIMGADQAAGDELMMLEELYAPIMQNQPRVVRGTWEEAESIKIFYNTFISAKIGLVNMIQDFAQRIGNIDVDVVTDALAHSDKRIMGPKYMTAGMGDAGACHPRDNIALRWLAQRYDLGYDIFDTIMHAREIQARNLAYFLIDTAEQYHLTDAIVIHGKTYKPDVPYCIGSYSTLVGHYIQQNGIPVRYLDPLADDDTDVVDTLDKPAVILLAHNRHVTYGYTGQDQSDEFYSAIPPGSVIVDPWRQIACNPDYDVVHYGNTRQNLSL